MPGVRRSEADHDDGLSVPEAPPQEHRRSPLVDSAIYVDGVRVASPASLPETFESLRQHPDGMAWIGLYRPEEHEVEALAAEFQLHRSPSRTRSTPISVPSSSATTTRCSSCSARPLPGRRRGGRVRRGPRVRRRRLRPHRSPQRSARVQLGAPTPREPAGPSPPRARGRALRRAGQSRRRLLPRRRRARQRHRRDRGRGVQRRAQGVPPHLRAVPGGRRFPARHPTPARGHHRAARRVRRSTPSTRSSSDYLRDVEDHLIQIIERIEEFRMALRDMLTVNATLVAQAAERGDAQPRARPATSRTRRSRRSPPGPRSCSLRRSSGPSTA